MDCECLAGCPFYNEKMATKPAIAGLMKKQYCHDDFNSCARHQVFLALGKEAVPSDLYPNQNEKARDILKKNHCA